MCAVPARGAHLDIVHAHEVPTVVQVLLQVTVLEYRAAQPALFRRRLEAPLPHPHV